MNMIVDSVVTIELINTK